MTDITESVEYRRTHRDIYNEDSPAKPVNIVLSKTALTKLEQQASVMGMKRNELIRQILYGQAFKEALAA